MNAEVTGSMISRAAGLILIVMGASSMFYLLPWFEPPGMATSGWSSYSPASTGTTGSDLLSQLEDTYYVVAGQASFYFPSAAQVVAGLALIFLSRPVGRWLAKGLT